jgi:hypothetical protein
LKKTISILKYIAIFILGFITNFSGVLDNISSIPSSYKELKKVYFYDGDYLSGKWSNDTEYLLGSGDLGISEGPMIVMQMEISDNDEVFGEILSEKICDMLPITWVISIESPEPGFFRLFSKREFYIKQLRNNSMEIVAILTLQSIDRRKKTIELKTKYDPMKMLPDTLTLGKDLPKFEENFEVISSYCAQSPKKFYEKMGILK